MCRSSLASANSRAAAFFIRIISLVLPGIQLVMGTGLFAQQYGRIWCIGGRLEGTARVPVRSEYTFIVRLTDDGNGAASTAYTLVFSDLDPSIICR